MHRYTYRQTREEGLRKLNIASLFCIFCFGCFSRRQLVDTTDRKMRRDFVVALSLLLHRLLLIKNKQGKHEEIVLCTTSTRYCFSIEDTPEEIPLKYQRLQSYRSGGEWRVIPKNFGPVLGAVFWSDTRAHRATSRTMGAGLKGRQRGKVP